MNWTGGNLQRFSKGKTKNSRVAKTQKEYFAKQRLKLQTRNSSQSPLKPNFASFGSHVGENGGEAGFLDHRNVFPHHEAVIFTSRPSLNKLEERISVTGGSLEEQQSRIAVDTRRRQECRNNSSLRQAHHDHTQLNGSDGFETDTRYLAIDVDQQSPRHASARSCIAPSRLASPSPVDTTSGVRRSLLNRQNWAGLAITRPVKLKFTSAEERDRIGKRRKLNKDDLTRRRVPARQTYVDSLIDRLAIDKGRSRKRDTLLQDITIRIGRPTGEIQTKTRVPCPSNESPKRQIGSMLSEFLVNGLPEIGVARPGKEPTMLPPVFDPLSKPEFPSSISEFLRQQTAKRQLQTHYSSGQSPYQFPLISPSLQRTIITEAQVPRLGGYQERNAFHHDQDLLLSRHFTSTRVEPSQRTGVSLKNVSKTRKMPRVLLPEVKKNHLEELLPHTFGCLQFERMEPTQQEINGLNSLSNDMMQSAGEYSNRYLQGSGHNEAGLVKRYRSADRTSSSALQSDWRETENTAVLRARLNNIGRSSSVQLSAEDDEKAVTENVEEVSGLKLQDRRIGGDSYGDRFAKPSCSSFVPGSAEEYRKKAIDNLEERAEVELGHQEAREKSFEDLFAIRSQELRRGKQAKKQNELRMQEEARIIATKIEHWMQCISRSDYDRVVSNLEAKDDTLPLPGISNEGQNGMVFRSMDKVDKSSPLLGRDPEDCSNDQPYRRLTTPGTGLPTFAIPKFTLSSEPKLEKLETDHEMANSVVLFDSEESAREKYAPAPCGRLSRETETNSKTVSEDELGFPEGDLRSHGFRSMSQHREMKGSISPGRNPRRGNPLSDQGQRGSLIHLIELMPSRSFDTGRDSRAPKEEPEESTSEEFLANSLMNNNKADTTDEPTSSNYALQTTSNAVSCPAQAANPATRNIPKVVFSKPPQFKGTRLQNTEEMIHVGRNAAGRGVAGSRRAIPVGFRGRRKITDLLSDNISEVESIEDPDE